MEKVIDVNGHKRHKKFNGYSGVAKVIRGIVVIVFAVYAMLLMFPYVYALDISLMENGRAFVRNPIHIPWPMHFENYVRAFQELEISNNNFFMMLLNSMWYSVLNPALGIFVSTCTGYVVCKYDFRGKKFIYNMVLVVMMIPVMGSFTAQYKLYTQLNLVNSPLILITAAGGFGSQFLYVYSFFKTVSWNYAEAAFMDGAGHFTVFYKIMMPMIMPMLTAFFVMGFVGAWNDVQGPLTWLEEMPTLSYGIYAYEQMAKYFANEPIYFAGVIISVIPVVILFIFFQNIIMNNVSIGGLKG